MNYTYRGDIRMKSIQSALGYTNIMLNMQDIFSVVDREALAGKHILLIDDVITSGSTIGACAEALLTIPGVRVSVLAIAMA